MSNFHVSYKFEKLIKSILMPYPKNVEELLMFLNVCEYFDFHKKDIVNWDTVSYQWYHHILFCAQDIDDINWDSEDQKHFNNFRENLIQEYHDLQSIIHYPYEN